MADLHEPHAATTGRSPDHLATTPGDRATTASLAPAGERPRRPRRRPVAAPAPTADHALAARAAEVAALLACPVLPASWTGPGLARAVDLVRRQLGPLHDRQMLAASYERESSRLADLRRLAADPGAPPLEMNATDAAYAIRWLELGADGGPLPPLGDLVSERGSVDG